MPEVQGRPKNAQVKSPIYKNLTGGLNVREGITDLGDNEAQEASNLVYYTAGALVRRGGWKKLIANSPTSNPLLGAYQAVFNIAGALTYYLFITDGVGAWYTTSPTASTVVWTSIIGSVTLDATQPYRFLMMNNIMVGYNGIVVFQWSGSGNITSFTAGGNTVVIQDLTYTALGTNKSATTIAYLVGGTAGSEAVTVTGQSIVVQIQSGTSTATQIRTAVLANASAAALVSVSVSGTGSNAQTAPISATFIQYVTCPTSRCGIVWQNYLFWIGGSTGGTYYPSRVFFSNLGDPTTYPALNFIDIPTPNDGEQLNGAAILYGNLMLFKRFSIYILQGTPPSNLILSRLNSSIGCVDPFSIVQVDNLIYFVSDKGLYAANLFNIRQVCYKVEPRYTSAIPVSSSSNPIWAANYKPKGQIFISLNCRGLYNSTVGTTNDRLMVHDYFNADSNGDPAAGEFIVGYTNYSLSAAKPSNPTGPSLMGDYFYPGNPSRSATVMSSFYDQWVYVFTDGSLGVGGPADEIAWLSTATYPQTDYLSKFFDFGDPDMIKQARWVWTTGQNYGSINLAAGIVYNNSPTAVSFVDYNSNQVTLQSANGSYFAFSVDDDGALTAVQTTDSTFLTTVILADANGQNWAIGVDNDGTLTTNKTTSSPGTAPIFASPLGFQYQITVDTDGALDSLPAFAPSVATITPGRRTAVLPIVNGVGGAKQGKYIQLYFTGIGILTQFSMDLILKGRRN